MATNRPPMPTRTVRFRSTVTASRKPRKTEVLWLNW